VGVDNIDVAAATRRGIWVANVPDYGVEEVADHALALTLNLLRGVTRLDHHVRAGGWDYRVVRPLTRISSLTVGVLGHGRIGATYARKVRALGPEVIVSDVRTLDDGVRQVPLAELFARAHLISVHVPAEGQDGVLLGEHEFAAMRDGAFLVNTARGALVDHQALLAALDSGKLAGAALDVLDQEPPGSKVLTGHERVLVTPHSAWYSEEAFRMLKDEVAHEVVRVLTSEPPRNPVNDIRQSARHA
jgi:D-3-phosphoglycerate dehydrogenase